MSVSPPVSIGMPVFNGEKYVIQAIDSLLGQSYCDFELIISDILEFALKLITEKGIEIARKTR